MLGRRVLDLVAGGTVGAANAPLCTDASAAVGNVEANGSLITSAANIPSAGGAPLGRFSDLAPIFTGSRYYLSGQAAMDAAIASGEDFTISALVSTYYVSASRAFFIGNSDAAGANASFSMGMQYSGLYHITLLPGSGSGGSLTWYGPGFTANSRMRFDLCRVNGLAFAFFNGQPGTGAAVPSIDSGSHIGAGKLSIGGVGEYVGGSDGGSSGDRWKGPIERVVFLKGVGLFTAAFDPYDPRPFASGRRR